jgi:myosin heavy subunit
LQGNIQFEETDSGSSVPQDMQYVDFAASLLGVDPEQLAAKLTSRQVRTNVGARGSVYDVPFAPLQVGLVCAALPRSRPALPVAYLFHGCCVLWVPMELCFD